MLRRVSLCLALALTALVGTRAFAQPAQTGAISGIVAAADAPVPAPAPIPSVLPAEAASASVAAAAAASAIAYPLPAPQAASESATLDVTAVLTDLFGRKSVSALFQLQDFPRRFVASVDNLGRAQAPKSLWPVNPAPGRFTVRTLNGASVISPDNGMRYTPYVLLIESVDMHQVLAVYTRLYPLFQAAYEEIGFPGRYFNDRLVEVVDQLLATPEMNDPIKVHLPTVAGSVQLTHPWLFYAFDDPALQSLSAGQKLLLRMGPVNERRVKTRLIEFRRLVTAGGGASGGAGAAQQPQR